MLSRKTMWVAAIACLMIPLAYILVPRKQDVARDTPVAKGPGNRRMPETGEDRSVSKILGPQASHTVRYEQAAPGTGAAHDPLAGGSGRRHVRDARVPIGGAETPLVANDAGDFPEVLIDPKVPTSVRITTTPGELVSVMILDGGHLDDLKHHLQLKANTEGEVRFDYTPLSQSGTYRVAVGILGEQSHFKFLVK